MLNELKLSVLPLSARQARSLPVRQHSLPSTKNKIKNKIKINLKRLPNDFFQAPSSMPQIAPIGQIMHKIRAQTHEASRRNIRMHSLNCQQLESKNQFQLNDGDRALPMKIDKMRKQPKQYYTQISSQNIDTMNWTFSRQFNSQQKRQKIKSTARTLPVQMPTPRRVKLLTQISRDRLAEKLCQGGQEGRQKITGIITDKLAELNVNRLRKNIRKNNHPPAYLQYIKKYYN